MTKKFLVATKIIVCIVLFSLQGKRSFVSIDDIELLSGHEALELYQLMKDVHEVLSEHNLPYWITGGTLLGAVGYGGIIPWDDDLDICIDVKHEKRLRRLEKELASLGYSLGPAFFGYQIFTDSRKHLDVFLMNEKGGEYTYANKRACRHWCKLTKMLVKDVYPLKEYLFGDCVVFGPHYAGLFLDYGYENWPTYAVVRNHSTYKRYKKYIHLKKGDRFPARPFGPLKDRVVQFSAS